MTLTHVKGGEHSNELIHAEQHMTEEWYKRELCLHVGSWYSNCWSLSTQSVKW